MHARALVKGHHRWYTVRNNKQVSDHVRRPTAPPPMRLRSAAPEGLAGAGGGRGRPAAPMAEPGCSHGSGARHTAPQRRAAPNNQEKLHAVCDGQSTMGTAPASAGARRGLFGAGDVGALSGNPFAALDGADELPITYVVQPQQTEEKKNLSRAGDASSGAASASGGQQRRECPRPGHRGRLLGRAAHPSAIAVGPGVY